MSGARLFLAFGSLAAVFGLAALWQAWKLDELRSERVRAAQIAAGEFAETPDGLLPAGTGVVIIGRLAGAGVAGQQDDSATGFGSGVVHAAGDAPADSPPVSNVTPPVAVSPPAQPVLGDFELEVQPGQTLSGIAHAHYGHASADLVDRLARYNGLADKNSLGAGHKLRLPPLETLNALSASR